MGLWSVAQLVALGLWDRLQAAAARAEPASNLNSRRLAKTAADWTGEGGSRPQGLSAQVLQCPRETNISGPAGQERTGLVGTGHGR